ncbi:hypothetical protein TorRG33x02_122020, partial [Trema orientale]
MAGPSTKSQKNGNPEANPIGPNMPPEASLTVGVFMQVIATFRQMQQGAPSQQRLPSTISKFKKLSPPSFE